MNIAAGVKPLDGRRRLRRRLPLVLHRQAPAGEGDRAFRRARRGALAPVPARPDDPARGQEPTRLSRGEVRNGRADRRAAPRRRGRRRAGGHRLRLRQDRRVAEYARRAPGRPLGRRRRKAGGGRRSALPRLLPRGPQHRRPRRACRDRRGRSAWIAPASKRGSHPTRIAARSRRRLYSAQQIGVTGVPTFIIADRYGVVGAQAPETLARAFAEIQAASAEERGVS